jgi:hypothetical protein
MYTGFLHPHKCAPQSTNKHISFFNRKYRGAKNPNAPKTLNASSRWNQCRRQCRGDVGIQCLDKFSETLPHCSPERALNPRWRKRQSLIMEQMRLWGKFGQEHQRQLVGNPSTMFPTSTHVGTVFRWIGSRHGRFKVRVAKS